MLARVREAVVEHTGLQPLFEEDGLVLFADLDDPQMRLRRMDSRSAFVLGALFERGATASSAPAVDRLQPELAAAELMDWLFARMWGRYLAIARDASSGEAFIGRDPSGGVPVHVVDCGGVALVSDALPAWLVNAIGRPLPIDQSLLANALAMPILTTHRSLLRNVVTVPAGGVVSWQARFGSPRLAWNPLRFCAHGGDSSDRVRAAVLECTQAFRSAHQTALLELSGGLDSAIVLGALASRAGPSDVICVNLATTYSGGDERAPAREAAERWSAELVELVAREEDVDYGRHLSGPQPVQPVLYGLDPILEAAVSGVADSFGASAIFTGQGGDAVFFQMPTDKVAIDFMRARGIGALFSTVAFDAARRSHASIWRVQWRMIRDAVAGTRPERVPAMTALLGPAARKSLEPLVADHPWLERSRELPPGKRMQLLAIANCQLFNGPTRRGQRTSLLHPLMSQPVVEACLAIPIYELSTGTGNRALARSLFADLLPPSILKRRGKGETSSYYRRAIVENLGFLRPHLLDGCLVANDLLDRHALDGLMCEQSVIWNDEARMITLLASFESWARHWGL